MMDADTQEDQGVYCSAKIYDNEQIGADHSAGDFWNGPHGYLKKLEDGRVIPVPKRECRCGFLGTATGELPRYECENEDCRVIVFA